MEKTNVALVTSTTFIATFMTAIEGTIVTTAMPTIIGSLHGINLMEWVFAIYLLATAMFTPVYGKLADSIGRKPLFMFGAALFIIGSTLCGFANSMIMLIICRFIQGIGAGALQPISYTLIADLYAPEKRATIMGLNTTAWGIASVFGPLIGGVIVDTIGWHWIFFLNVPFGLAIILIIWTSLHEKGYDHPIIKVDYLGTVLLMLTLMMLLIALQLFGDQGLTISVVITMVVTIIAGIAFVLTETRVNDPIISMNLFKNRMFVGANIITLLLSGFFIGVNVYVPMWLQGVYGLSATIGGLSLAPASIFWFVGSLILGRLMDRLNIRIIFLIFLAITIVGGASLLVIYPSTSWVFIFILSGVIGVGLGGAVVLGTIATQRSVPENQLGVATSFNQLVKTLGSSIMVSIFGLILNTQNRAGLTQAHLLSKSSLMNDLVDASKAKTIPSTLLDTMRNILFNSIHTIFIAGLVLLVLSVIFLPLIKNQEKAE